MFQTIKHEWFSNVKGDVLSGIVVALALIPEAIAFSVIAGVDPMVGLYAAFCIAVTISFVGGRTGMISAATGAMALLMVTLVKDHGLQYLFAATILTGVVQIIFGVLKLSSLMKFVPRPVMSGFVNALGILIFTAQLPHFHRANWQMYVLVALGLAIIYLFPRMTTAVPSTLVAILAVTSIALISGFQLRTVGDMGSLPKELPFFHIPDVPFTLETFAIILPYSIMLAVIGLLESLLTASLLDDITDTSSNKHKEARGQGIANIVAGFFGGMAGCAMIGQSLINMKSGGRGRLSTFVAGGFLIVLLFVLGDYVVHIPMAALVAVMIVVSIGTFDWKSVFTLHKVPKGDAFVMIVTVIIVLITHNLGFGVIVGTVISAVLFAVNMAKIHVKHLYIENKKIYEVHGQLFFASTTEFINAFQFKEDVQEVTIDFTHAHVWDDSAVAAVDKVMMKYEQNGIQVNIVGLNERSLKLITKLATHNKQAIS
ncbi:SulP family inorganic anion transporter [Bacillus cytotoxicus]|uniref:Sulphate transporter n=1 Tax=Bacillus cytotoxicus (strain DSM 22905 / CIP 110041 / 391-98 / NVH 391-98) TaxID=315749 RepID=A7GL90_BACCN|nr:MULTISPECIES: SulP family inorganic anion transporter [Bacillus cereus group]ABS20898.1 sulphate transporter [Bacillus cytotoxicus NVH 391-98]AWC31545.1 SulP family inorganic anion transporter [Bacillus cytotoxicus]AWC35585.1 SulP family inorganic anion transporter [Bacillus cytotoxicus]AWC43634.1 SulP family inorganic anion transporter [Bacillus cytotoxicus]AWC59817.1 SulP family inorganic anion transporter [Bacillus cytotoxicus]